ncbi:transcription termination/antitermination factor NusG [Puniceicoccales bacterium CK1056]|uniref:Transcription termination/antitermination protein NusG n=1 Tax=Oceanipulchritudo coccoides TaxID=2706888 RepID=A0A6B2M2U4_9BACT|nr:transcription termination/antitermination protein NusG [Oceanipulchritudo coccoides]NDV62632.1 transcription termination/antitermination factor NusG [Oceanipulchritudo coccoides]
MEEDSSNSDNPVRQGQWFVVQTLSNKEPAAKRYIDRYISENELEDFVFEALIPDQTVSEVKHGKKSQRKRKLYPGYIFVHCRLYDENNDLVQKVWYFINGADGVIGFAGGKSPAPLKDSEIDRILKQVEESEGKEVPKVQYEVGEEVKITDGPFLNLSGRIDEIDTERGKLKVSVSIFGRFTPVELEYWQVERMTDGD